MATELARIAELSAQNPTMVFTSIAHLINVKLLRECHEKMDGDKAVGIDGGDEELILLAQSTQSEDKLQLGRISIYA